MARNLREWFTVLLVFVVVLAACSSGDGTETEDTTEITSDETEDTTDITSDETEDTTDITSDETEDTTDITSDETEDTTDTTGIDPVREPSDQQALDPSYAESREGGGEEDIEAGVLQRLETRQERFDKQEFNCDYNGVLVDNQNLDIIMELFHDSLYGTATGEAEMGESVTFFPGTQLDELLARASELFTVEGIEKQDQAAREVLAAFGISPNTRLQLAPRLNGGPATDPIEVIGDKLVASSVASPGGHRVLVIDVGVDTAIVGTGIDGELDQLKGGPSVERLNGPNPLQEPFAGHGTFIAEIIARYSSNVAGITVSDLFDASDEVYDIDLVQEVEEIMNGTLVAFDAANLSFGGYPCSTTGDTSSADPADYLDPIGQRIALEYLHASGVSVMAAAAGNDNTTRPFFPAAFYSSPTPDKTSIQLAGDSESQAFSEMFDDWKAKTKPATDLKAIVTSVGAQSIAVPYHNLNPDYSNTGDWVSVKNEQGCHVSLMPMGTWYYDEDTGDHDELESGWAWWCGTSFAAPFWLADQLN